MQDDSDMSNKRRANWLLNKGVYKNKALKERKPSQTHPERSRGSAEMWTTVRREDRIKQSWTTQEIGDAYLIWAASGIGGSRPITRSADGCSTFNKVVCSGMRHKNQASPNSRQ